jgi:hypothetical protein
MLYFYKTKRMFYNKIASRIKSDYLIKSSKIDGFKKLLFDALENGYSINTLSSYLESKRLGSSVVNNKTILNRHDIDTDPSTARLFFEVEKELNVKATYYFRLSTIDIDLMEEINSYGSEVGYHYEEIATYCKRFALKTRMQVESNLPDIQELFLSNFEYFNEKLSFPIQTVASHGDFVNRAIGIPNWVLLTPLVREKASIKADAYDSLFDEGFLRISDILNEEILWKGGDPFQQVLCGEQSIHLLTHPRSWRSSFSWNTKDNVLRLLQGIIFHLR